MSQPTTAGDDAAWLLSLANVIDPAVPATFAVGQSPDPQADAALRLRDIAAHLDRIATGGDRAAPTQPSQGVE